MDAVSQSSRSTSSKIKQAVGSKGKEQQAGRDAAAAPPRSLPALGLEPQLSSYIVTRALNRPEVGDGRTPALRAPCAPP